ncbi:hypothetical protein SAMN04489727_6287 [Amycolatopsis tolypomycina]|uniref:Uncharacterized protein n=1 Tax=Amycolatopsis tolypomycina TaxID=208445 RepID=A0A1H4XNW6_9PSEU|nr:hypothetical protein [Amycolatopsis tolypomycina]SED07313.1 hypothetical protein SAMN04489727_6287 [Amycolatopsis tolypomycina]
MDHQEHREPERDGPRPPLAVERLATPAPARAEGPMDPRTITALQGGAGNQAVSSLLGAEVRERRPAPPPKAPPVAPATPAPEDVRVPQPVSPVKPVAAPELPAPARPAKAPAPPSAVPHGIGGRRPAQAAPVTAPPAAAAGAQQVVAAVAEAGAEGQATLAAAVDEQLALVETTVEEQQETIEQETTGELAAVEAGFTAAEGRVTTAVAGAQQRMRQAGQAEQARLTAWSTEAGRRLDEGYAARTGQIRALGTTKGAEAVTAANTSAADTRTQVDALAGQARTRGAQRAASPGGADAEGAQARAAAAREVAADTATRISESLGDTVTQLRDLGPETRAQLVGQANEIADRIRTQLPSITAVLTQTTEGAGSQLGQAISAGCSSLTRLGADVAGQLAALRSSVTQAIREQVDLTKAAVRDAGAQAVAAGQAQHDQAAQGGAALLDGILGGIANRRVRRAAAARLAGELSAQVRQGFGDTGQQARVALAEIAQAFSTTAGEALDAVRAAAGQARDQAAETAAAGQAGADGQAASLAEELARLVSGAQQSGDRTVDGAFASLDRTIADLDARFGQALGQFREALAQRAAEATGRAREPLGTLDGRMDQAMREAEEATHRSWLENAVRSVPWGMVAGLVVGLLVTIAVVALLGTGIGALILAGALAGALSAAATTLTDNAVHGRDTNWSELGRQMVVGAIFGAIGGAIGGGVSGALGAAVERQLLTQAGALAIGKAANVVTGATLGIVNNVVAGRPWHEGLLVNIGMSIALSYGPGGRFIENVTSSARGAMVDSGHAFNVTPAEINASSARMQARADAMPDAPVEGALPHEEPPTPVADERTTVPGGGEEERTTVPGGGEEDRPTVPGGGEDERTTVPGGAEDERTTVPGGAEDERTTVPGGPEDERTTMPGGPEEDRPTIPNDEHADLPVEDLPDGTVMHDEHPMSEADARVMYENARRDAPHNEVAVYRNSETGECIVVQGNNEFVDAYEGRNPAMREFLESRPGEPGRWDLVEHSHPVDPASGVTLEPHRYPSGRGGDFDVARLQAEAGGRPVEQTIGIVTERGNETVTYGYDPANPEPYSLTYPDAQGNPVTRRFRSMEAYGEWYENQPGTGGGTPHLEGDATPAAAAPGEREGEPPVTAPEEPAVAPGEPPARAAAEPAEIDAGIRRVRELLAEPEVTAGRRGDRAFERDVQGQLRNQEGRTLEEQLQSARADAEAARELGDPAMLEESRQRLDALRDRVEALEGQLRRITEGDLPGEQIVEGPVAGEPPERAAERARVEGSAETRANFRRQVAPDEVVGAPAAEGGTGQTGHARSGHGWSEQMQADILNRPDRVFTGLNSDGRAVDIYYRNNGDVAITVAGRKEEVITAYGPSDPDGTGSFNDVSKWADKPGYVEINPRNGRPIRPGSAGE